MEVNGEDRTCCARTLPPGASDSPSLPPLPQEELQVSELRGIGLVTVNR